MEKRLFRNEHDKVIGGVCSGLAIYLNVDVTVIRLLFVLCTIFLVGTGILAYFVMWIIVPANNDPMQRYAQFNDFYKKNSDGFSFNQGPEDNSQEGEKTKWNTPNYGADFGMSSNQPFGYAPKNNDTGRTVAGLVLLLLGIFFLLKEFYFIPYWFNIFKLWPLVIVAIGISLIFRKKRKTEWEQFKRDTEQAQRARQESTMEEATIVRDDSSPNSQEETKH